MAQTTSFCFRCSGSVETFQRRRETEIKHGRVAMYATIGHLGPNGFGVG